MEPGKRECPFCGRAIAENLRQCPFCREAVPEVPHLRRDPNVGKKQIRQGLLLVLLTSFVYYLTTDASPWVIPFTVPSVAKDYFLPLSCLVGLILALYGLFLRFRG